MAANTHRDQDEAIQIGAVKLTMEQARNRTTARTYICEFVARSMWLTARRLPQARRAGHPTIDEARCRRVRTEREGARKLKAHVFGNFGSGLPFPSRLPEETAMKAAITALTAMLLLSGCGTTMGDRGLSGASIGAGIGLIAGPPGVLVGGVVGAGVGMVTKPRQVNLGRPVWRD